MKKLTKNIYFGLIILLAGFSVLNVYLPQGHNLPMQDLPTSKSNIALINMFIMIVIYGGLGYIGLKLSEKINVAKMWDKKINIKNRLTKPIFIGTSVGLIFIVLDIIFSNFNSIGMLPHPAFPTSIVASITAGIGEEVIFRLFFISFWVWLISVKIFNGKHINTIFWVISFLSAIIFTVAHLPSIMFLIEKNSIWDIPLLLNIELFLMNGLLSIVAAYYFKKYGILAAIGIHFWTDIVWHVLWGLI